MILSAKEIYKLGFEAGQTGKMAADCPYAYDSPEGKTWMRGYEEGGGDD